MDRTPGNPGTSGNPGNPGTSSPAASRRALLRGGLALGAVAAAGLANSVHADAGTRAAAGAVDYPSAVWSPASTSNYTASNRPTSYPVNLVVIHVTQEDYADTIRLFQDPAHAASAHYVVKSSNGAIGQCVRERDIAWHAGNWGYNTRSIGIEHEGWVDQPAYFTTAMYHSSAALTAAICDKYGIPKDRDHIIGHVQVPGTDHTDPGPNWDWVRYIRLVNGV
ncbi:N-acetylmuramoyl-L-alanine amidase [Streptomyces sp. NPDC006733]|uniref:N-acetylmuramoyl-L-alanine amidase n=1 Tax=Streptomyces sp. NPDC006733 TaxID=3155460 RepID=UPI0033D00FDE